LIASISSFGKNLAARGIEGMRQGKEALWPEAPLADLVRVHCCKLFPSHPAWQLDTHPFLERLPALHGNALGGVVTQVIALLVERW
jgi:hypothetical protein